MSIIIINIKRWATRSQRKKTGVNPCKFLFLTRHPLSYSGSSPVIVVLVIKEKENWHKWQIRNFRKIVTTVQSFDLFFRMRIFTCSPVQANEYYSVIFQIIFADPLKKSPSHWREHNTEIRYSLVIKIWHNLLYLL